VILAFLTNLDEQRGELVNRSKDIGNGFVEFIDDVFAMLSADGIVPAISRGIPLHASRFLRIVDLTAGRTESHIIALPFLLEQTVLNRFRFLPSWRRHWDYSLLHPR
jgi:hypothetical protein